MKIIHNLHIIVIGFFSAALPPHVLLSIESLVVRRFSHILVDMVTKIGENLLGPN